MNQRDMEQLSEYLDGRLNPSASARLETRLASDPALASTLQALRESRNLLRRLPHRRAPRNFTLTRQMVGLKPPLPRAYPIFRFATAFAALLFALSFLVNPAGQMANSAPMSAYGIGGGAEAATEAPMMAMAPAATEAPAQEMAPTEMALSVPAASPEPSADTSRAMQEPAAKNAAEPAPAPPLTQWQIILAGTAILGAAAMLILRQLAARKWR